MIEDAGDDLEENQCLAVLNSHVHLLGNFPFADSSDMFRVAEIPAVIISLGTHFRFTVIVCIQVIFMVVLKVRSAYLFLERM